MENFFWEVVEAGAEAPYYFYGPKNRALRVTRMKNAVKGLKLSDHDTVKLYEIALRSIDKLYNQDVHGACTLFWGGMSDDSFIYHCRWITSLGLDQYTLALSDPDTFYSSFVDETPHPVSPYFETFVLPFKEPVENRNLEDHVSVTLSTGHALGKISIDLLRQRFPRIAGKLLEHQCDDFDSFSEAAERTKLMLGE